ncbi:unnamed protein product [Amoebophrya sp. A120]|nr:unnamed protein product [Amoebophrya sp. A120]|eukprot:GSA120T00025988001.1
MDFPAGSVVAPPAQAAGAAMPVVANCSRAFGCAPVPAAQRAGVKPFLRALRPSRRRRGTAYRLSGYTDLWQLRRAPTKLHVR